MSAMSAPLPQEFDERDANGPDERAGRKQSLMAVLLLLLEQASYFPELVR